MAIVAVPQSINMLQPKLIALVVLGLLELETDAVSYKLYMGSFKLTDPAAWLDDYLPCARDLLVFPSNYPAVLPLPDQLAVRGFELPREGALLLNEDSTITLGTGKGLSPSCDSDERRAVLRPPKTSKWFDPSIWSDQVTVSATSEDASIAPFWTMTDLERVPCDDEHILIRSNTGALSFDMENVQYLRLGQLVLAGSSISRMYLQELLQRDLGQLMFHNAQLSTVEYYRGELCGCHKDFEQLIEPVCHNVQCEVPHCVSPVRPFGSCCFLCGALVTMPGGHCTEEVRNKLEAYINKAIDKESLSDELQVHVNYVVTRKYGNLIQAIVQERGTYSERSVEFMRHLAAISNASDFWSSQPTLNYAGHPYNPNVTFGSVLLILFCIVFVGIVAIIILAHYMPEHPYLNRIPQWIHDPRRWRWRHLSLRLRRNLLFNRFDNNAASGGQTTTDRLAVMGYDAERDEVRERSFNNPMFEQEPVQEELQSVTMGSSNAPQLKLEVDAPTPNVEIGELDSCSVEEQELTEINLESTTDESDVEAETKE